VGMRAGAGEAAGGERSMCRAISGDKYIV
jgi:hypothetical protein